MNVETTTDHKYQFREALVAHGLNPSEILADGAIHRIDDAIDKPGRKSAWYLLHDDGDFAAGSFGNWKTGLSEKWSSKSLSKVLPEQRTLYFERLRTDKEQADIALREIQKDTAQACEKIWNYASEAGTDNPYLLRKKINSYGLKEFKDSQTLIVPLRDESGNMASLQFIDKDGNKKFKTGGRKHGCYFSIGDKPQNLILICEGYATGASLHEATGFPVAVAFDAGNMESVGQSLLSKLPNIEIIFCADNDRFNERGNTGTIKAKQAALNVGGKMAIPQFKTDIGKPTDFNDLHQQEGLGTVRHQIEVSNMELPEIIKGGWNAPEPFSRSSMAVQYPVDELPTVVRSAVIEVQGFTKAPFAMVACSALATLSLTAQAHHDVQRAEKLTGPIGLYFLVIAESGERKTTCDGIFSKVLRDYEGQQQESAKPDVKRYEAEKCGWDAIKTGIVDRIKQEAKNNKSTERIEQDLHNHIDNEPKPPRIPRLVYSDFTPEALTHCLAHQWPSGGVVSSEGGAVFGSHGMGKESQMRTLSSLNQLWDGARLTFDRKGGSYVIDGARLTMSLQVQEATLMEFFKKTGALARGTGFLARFLMAHPESTQGTRLFSEPPKDTPSLAEYYNQINRILQTPVPINDDGGLEPSMLTLSPEAKIAWIKFHDEIELGLGKGGELQDVRDVASKIADNATRLAALFHIVDGGLGAIGVNHFVSASIISAWHLNESLRFFGELAMPEELANAARLSEWLVSFCKIHRVSETSTRSVSQFGPYQVRDRAKRDAAILELIDRNHIAVLPKGRKQVILINPQLLILRS